MTSIDNVKFILLTTQRSGSTYLSDLLRSHSSIYMANELFKVNGDMQNVDSDNYRFHSASIDEYLNSFYKSKTALAKTVGFSIMLKQFERHPDIKEYIIKNNIKCIYLERTNFLKTAISRYKARMSGVYHSKSPVNMQSIIVDIDFIIDEIEEIRTSVAKLRSLSSELKAYEVTYEKLLKNKKHVLDGVQNYLNIKNEVDLHSDLVKTTSDDLKKAVVNYKELIKVLENSPYSEYLKY